MHAAPSILLRLLKWEDEMKMAADYCESAREVLDREKAEARKMAR